MVVVFNEIEALLHDVEIISEGGASANPSTVETRLIASLQPHTVPIETQILRAILSTGDASAIIKANHMMPTVIAEQINEAYYDQFADNIVDCDGENITIVEDNRKKMVRNIMA
jgi:hypothetical protein